MVSEISPQDVCHQLLYELRMSNLHYALSETPHSVQIVTRKRFLKDKTGPAKPPSHFFYQDQELQRVDSRNILLKAEISDLKENIVDLEAQCKSCHETVKILEEKIAPAFKSFEKN